MTTKILDTNRNTFGHYDALKAAGVETVIRYVAAGLAGNEKVIKPGEARAIAEAGMKLGLVYEIGGRPSGSAVGARDGAYARNYAPTVGAPTDGSVIIWYTVDWDAGPGDYPGIKAAFAAFKEALGDQFRVGAYASGYICNKLKQDGLIVARWLIDSKGFLGTRQALNDGSYEMSQALPQTIAGLDTDPDAAHIGVDGKPADIGDFVPFGSAPVVAEQPAPEAPQAAPAPVPTADRFPACLPWILKMEGGNDDDPHDPGGRTSRGIIQREYNAYRHEKGEAQQDVWKASDAEVADIYEHKYWLPISPTLPAGVDLIYFDVAVNAGPGQGAKQLQRALGVAVDGAIGPQTHAAVAAADPVHLIKAFSDVRRSFYRGLAQFGRYGRGWLSRVDQIEAAALKMTSAS